MGKVFPYFYEGRFDEHLELLLILVQEFVTRGGDFKEMVTVDPGMHSWDLACHQVAFLRHKALVNQQHPNSQTAWRIFEIVGQRMDIEDCLFVDYLEHASVLLRNTKPNLSNTLYGQSLMKKIFQDLVDGYYDKVLYAFPDLVHALLECRGDPNLSFTSIKIRRKGEYQNPTCLHVTYLCWKSLKEEGRSEDAKYVRKAFFHLLRDPSIDVRVQFSEIALERDGGHFSSTSNMFEGDYIEEGTLAHYALADGDFDTCKKVLSLAHDLMGSTCCTTSGKWLLHNATLERGEGTVFQYTPDNVEILWNDELPHWWGPKSSIVVRHKNVSLCHIAARRLDLLACTYLAAIGGAQGLSNDIVQYAKLHLEDFSHSFQQIKTNRKIFRTVMHALKTAHPLPTILPQAFYTLHHEGYDVMYHPDTKCPIVREVLHVGSLVRNVDTKKYQGYRQDHLIPEMNRAALADFKTPGIICGHARPRANANISDQALYDVGYLTNIMAQDPMLNNGLWKKLEKMMRDWTQQHLCLHVYTGGAFTSPFDIKGPKTITHGVIGLNEVHVPTHLFKVVYAYDYGIGWRSCAYLIPNIPLNADTDLNQYLVSVQRIQEITGVDFLGKYR